MLIKNRFEELISNIHRVYIRGEKNAFLYFSFYIYNAKKTTKKIYIKKRWQNRQDFCKKSKWLINNNSR